MCLAAIVTPASAEVPPAVGGGAERMTDGLWRLVLDDGAVLYTHGPDPAPDHGGGMGPGDPERDPVCSLDFHQHVLYGRPADREDRSADVVPAIRASIRRMNAVLAEEALATGDREADYKVKCDLAGEIQVDTFIADASDFNSIVTGARASGFVAPTTDYTIFFDGSFPGVCGIASYLFDPELQDSPNNLGAGYAVTYRGCWNGGTPMHENGHNQGAVATGAPYSTGSGHHCADENDIMCYSPDGGDRNQRGTFARCTDRVYFDCGHDTYFDAAPEHGEYLETHWNIGSPNNRFIRFGPVLERPPVASFQHACGERTCSFADMSTDGGPITWAWDFGDGQTSSEQHASHTFGADGTYEVMLTVTDQGGLTSSQTQSITVPVPDDPDPAAPTLINGAAARAENGPVDSWQYFKVLVPAGRPSITFTLIGQPCVLAFCQPNLDLYVRAGARPDLGLNDCWSASQRDDEVCSMEATPGYWFIGVYTRATLLTPVLGAPSTPFTITATY
jgi:hypothetical protein